VPTHNCSNLVDLLRTRVSANPDHVVYSFLTEDRRISREISLRVLDERARAVAAFLQSGTNPGDRILLAYPFGPEFLEGFWGSIYAGRIPVPAYAPRPGRPSQTLSAICNDAAPSMALTNRDQLGRIRQMLAKNLPAAGFGCWCVEDISDDTAGGWAEPAINSSSIAFLQYTSGSTSTPKGVIVSHGNIIHNERMIQEAFGEDESSIVVSWLPLYHDMGLIGGVLQPLWSGGRCFLMSPQTFIQTPIRWLEAISRFKATTSGGPDFAYRLCTARVGADQLATLDLSCWRVAFNGSEPVQAKTISEFSDKFGVSGFRKSAFVPCYGLAESTLLVTAKKTSAELSISSFQARELERNRVASCAEQDSGVRTLVGCGVGDSKQDLVVVNGESGAPCSAGEIGEIWLSGPHVAQGYWNQPKETEDIFAGKPAGRDGTYLRTGDLGFVLNGELYITGRSRDLIVLRGRNFYPQDFEMLASQSQEAFQAGLGAAFTVNTNSEPELVIVQETQNRNLDFGSACAAIRGTVVEEYDISPAKIVLVRFGTLPKTSSGKIRRQECKARLLAGELNIVFEEAAQPLPDSEAEGALPADHSNSRDLRSRETLLVSIVQRILRLSTQAIDPEVSLLSLGLDSLAAAELKATLERDLKVDVPLECLLEGTSLAGLSRLIGQKQSTIATDVAADSAAIPSTYTLSQGQLAIWYLSCLSPESAAYNISVAMECGEELREDIFKEALESLIRRHQALRTVVRSGEAGPYQRVLSEPRLTFDIEEVEGLSDEALQQALWQNAERPFNLEEAPLFRVSLFRTSTKRVLLFVFHHIVVDFVSLELILSELATVYRALSKGERYDFATEAGLYSEYVQWQQQMLCGERGAELRSFWHERLQGELPITELPSVKVRPGIQSYRGDSHQFRIGGTATQLLGERARALGVSLHSILLAGFQVLIHRYTSQSEVMIGMPAAGRLSSRWVQTIGLFINQIALRTELSGERQFADLARQVHREMAAALAHQEYPFALLVEQLQPRRDPSHSPLFQMMFSFYRAQRPEHKGLEAFLLGIPGIELQAGGLKLRSMPLKNRTAQLDLTMSLAEVEGELCGNLQWNADLFDVESMREVAAHYVTVMEAVANQLQTRVSEIVLAKPGDKTFIHSWSDPPLQVGNDESVPVSFMNRAAAFPSATALVAGRESMTYTDLAAEAISLAAYLRTQGIGPDVPIAIFASRSRNLLVGMLGALLAGGAFVPIDPSLPPERASNMIAQSHAPVLLTEEKLLARIPRSGAKAITLDQEFPEPPGCSEWNPGVRRENLAYILFTSGSTGKPKGVMVSHGNLTSFCKAMDEQISCGPGDTFFATTSISFDISILELLWPLTRGAQVTILPEQLPFTEAAKQQSKAREDMDFSVFYFSSSDGAGEHGKYKLMIEGAKYADRHGFCAVWTPERHFHEFGGLFPNPSVTSAALATITQRVGIRAGSVVLPLHDPIRVAEEWSVVDNLSNGRIGMAMASGWHADDFAFFPDRYEDRKELMYRDLLTLQQLWKGEPVSVRSGSGKSIEVRIYPKPVQPALPIWITAAGTAETFQRAGEIGANILTHLLGQSIEKLAVNLRSYRESRRKHGHDPAAGKVTLMLHTFLGDDLQSVRDQVRTPFKNYLRTSIDLIGNLIRSEGLNLDLNQMSPRDFDDLLSFAFDRYFETSGLFGTMQSCREMVSALQEIGVNEIGCLIDFGVETGAALTSLSEVTALMEGLSSRQHTPATGTGVGDPDSRRILQCTPSMARLLFDEPANRDFLDNLDILLLGGEALPVELAETVKTAAPDCRVINMYGPTETTIWSAIHPVNEIQAQIPIGKPLANNTVHILDNYGHPAPAGMRGEIYLGGDGVARGYVNSPAMTAEKFVPDPFSRRPGMRLYRTGDIGVYRKDGSVEFLGRKDAQVKIRGYRIELAEIEATLSSHVGVRQCVVSVRSADNVKSLVAHTVSNEGKELRADELRKFLKLTLPEYMIPSQFIFLKEMPLTTSGKIDRQRLPEAEKQRPLLETNLIMARDRVEGDVVAIWKQVLRLPELGIDDNFFDLGGHSLLMAQAHRAIQDHFQITVPLIKLLECPTVRTLAAYLRGTSEKDASAEFETRARKQKMATLLQRQTAARMRLIS